MGKGRKNKPYRQMDERFPPKSKRSTNFGGPANDGKEPAKPANDGKGPAKPANDSKGPVKPADDREGSVKPANDRKESAKPADDRKGSAKPANDRKGPAKPANDRKGPAKPANNRKGPAKPANDRKGTAKLANNRKGPAKPANDGKGPAKPANNGKGPAKPANNGKGPAKPANNGKGPVPNRPNRRRQRRSKKRALINNSVIVPGGPMRTTERKNYSRFKRRKTGIPNQNTGATVEQSRIRNTDAFVPNVSYPRQFYGYTEQDNDDEPQLSCSVCRSKVLRKFLELHAWMHLSWLVQVGDRYPFQCTRCDFSAFRIPDVVCHAKEAHGNVGTSLFHPTVSDEILQSFFEKVVECFPPTISNNV
ncbi:unnamed protein product [Cercopithifilaria johnstoni]|uniref:Uncharacterized protein n=1 Tax=Cercopithifilaria johnstoni TaxID=2874296 RepID=A0A8J2M1Q1_9BILA|nr:unnamed protein product [Cercopithifilaria johnstoni]